MSRGWLILDRLDRLDRLVRLVRLDSSLRQEGLMAALLPRLNISALLMPAAGVVHSLGASHRRSWKVNYKYLAENFQCLTFPGSTNHRRCSSLRPAMHGPYCSSGMIA